MSRSRLNGHMGQRSYDSRQNIHMVQRSYESRQYIHMGQRSCGFKGQKMSINDSPEECISNAGHSPNIISTYEAVTSDGSNQEFITTCNS